jgi:hypothetical protein
MDAEEWIAIERRMGHLERQIATYDALLRRNTEILDEIRMYINRPTNWPEWIAAAAAILVLSGTLLYTAYVKPLEVRVMELGERVVENAAHIRATGDYSKEIRSTLDAHTANKEHSSSGSGRN